MSGISDDSGISSASSPINGMSTNHEKSTPIICQGTSGNALNTTNTDNNKDVTPKKSDQTPIPYKRSFTVNPSSTAAHSPASHHHNHMTVGTLTRAISTPQIFTPTTKRFAMNGSQKGMMQRFLASRGKYSPAGSGRTGKDLILVGKSCNCYWLRLVCCNYCPYLQTSVELNRSPINITPEFSPPIIERDENGRPLRRGYVPVEEKIQQELRDLKSRESELKRRNRMSKLRQSQPDLLDAVNDSIE